MFIILRPFPREDRAAFSCTEKGQLKRVTVHTDLRSDELISYMQGIVCSKYLMKTLYLNLKQHNHSRSIKHLNLRWYLPPARVFLYAPEINNLCVKVFRSLGHFFLFFIFNQQSLYFVFACRNLFVDEAIGSKELIKGTWADSAVHKTETLYWK